MSEEMSPEPEQKKLIAKDFTGKDITPGCVVAYPVRRDSRMWLNLLNVTQLIQEHETMPVYLTGYRQDGRKTNIHNLENVIVVQEHKLPA